MNMHQLQILAKWVVQNGYFQVQDRVIHQVLGAPIGNPMLPVLCSLAILHQEIPWHAEHDSPYKLVPIRFVDNLLTDRSANMDWVALQFLQGSNLA